MNGYEERPFLTRFKTLEEAEAAFIDLEKKFRKEKNRGGNFPVWMSNGRNRIVLIRYAQEFCIALELQKMAYKKKQVEDGYYIVELTVEHLMEFFHIKKHTAKKILKTLIKMTILEPLPMRDNKRGVRVTPYRIGRKVHTFGNWSRNVWNMSLQNERLKAFFVREKGKK
jgi:hypothetical protein